MVAHGRNQQVRDSVTPIREFTKAGEDLPI
jgi:hypothetical protein